jgi:3-methyladenine DNA glycosylase AlkD
MQTDSQRLFFYATHLAEEKEFFIRKAIAWALRDYAKWCPEPVRHFVQNHASYLSPLTVREALKNLR